MKQKLKIWFFIWLAGMIIITSTLSFLLPAKTIDLEEANFSTSRSALIYFKNIRSYFYDKVEEKKANFVMYRINSRVNDASNKLNFVIVSNWQHEESYILAESGLVDIKKKPLLITYQNSTDLGSIQFIAGDIYAHYQFAALLFQQLQSDAKLELLVETIPIEFTTAEKKSLKKTLKDYFKLIGKIR